MCGVSIGLVACKVAIATPNLLQNFRWKLGASQDSSRVLGLSLGDCSEYRLKRTSVFKAHFVYTPSGQDEARRAAIVAGRGKGIGEDCTPIDRLFSEHSHGHIELDG